MVKVILDAGAGVHVAWEGNFSPLELAKKDANGMKIKAMLLSAGE